MFGIYSNKRISKEESKILKNNPDDYNWYCVYVNCLFGDNRFFQVREDIELPQSEDDDGVVLMFQGGDIVYFKTFDDDVTQEELKSIRKVCSYLVETFNKPVSAYVVYPAYCELKTGSINRDVIFVSSDENVGMKEMIDGLKGMVDEYESEDPIVVPIGKRFEYPKSDKGTITIISSTFDSLDGEQIIDELENKLKNHEEFTYSDSINHMLLPYAKFKDKEVFEEEFNKYMALVKEYGKELEVE